MERALQDRLAEHHRFVLDELLQELAFLETRIARLEAEIERRLSAHASVIERLCTIPGIDRVTAWSLIAELGLDMTQFPDLASAPNAEFIANTNLPNSVFEGWQFSETSVS